MALNSVAQRSFGLTLCHTRCHSVYVPVPIRLMPDLLFRQSKPATRYTTVTYHRSATHPTAKAVIRAGILTLLLASVPALANSLPVSLELTGTVNNHTLAGVYVNPYQATVNGAVTTIICNDFDAETYFGETWQATLTNLDSVNNDPSLLANLRFGSAANALTLYNQAAWLSLQLLEMVDANNTAAQGEISFAIWGLFTPSALNYISAATRTAAEAWISAAQGSNFVADSRFLVYTPVPGQAWLSDGSPAPSSPQEFITVRAPESSSVLLLGFHFAAVLAFAIRFRRRLIHPAG